MVSLAMSYRLLERIAALIFSIAMASIAGGEMEGAGNDGKEVGRIMG